MLQHRRLFTRGKFQKGVFCNVAIGPRRKALIANVVRKLNKIRLIAVNRIAADVLVKKQRTVEQKRSKYQPTGEEKKTPGKQGEQGP
jgi:hypothetical protein